MQEDEAQLDFDALLRIQKYSKKSTGKMQSVKAKRARATAKKPVFEVALVHEKGVDWRLDCFQVKEEELDAGYYDHLAREALKAGLLKILKRPNPLLLEVQLLSLILVNLGVDLPDYLKIDVNKNLLEHDFWCDSGEVQKGRFGYHCSSYLWAFYFTDFKVNQVVLKHRFTAYPAEETDVSFLIDYELAMAKYPGIESLVV